MRGKIWRTSQECHHLALIVSKSCRDELRTALAWNVAQFLKPPEFLTRLHVLATTRFDSSEPVMPVRISMPDNDCQFDTAVRTSGEISSLAYSDC